MSDQELMELVMRAKQGESEARNELWEVLRPLRQHFIKQTYLDYWHKEDLEQQSYIILLEALERYDESQGMGFAGYYKTRLRIWRGRQKKRKTCESSNVESVERAMNNHSEGSEDRLIDVENKILLGQIMECIEQLEEEDKLFIIDSVIKGRDAAWLAKEYGQKSSTLRSRKKRLIAKLKEEMQKK